MTENVNTEYPLGPAIECFRTYPFDEKTDPDVTHLARYLADVLLRTDTEPPIAPHTFAMLAVFAIHGLEQGKNSFTLQSMPNHPLVARDPEVYNKLYGSLPELTEEGFSYPFKNVVCFHLEKMGVIKS